MAMILELYQVDAFSSSLFGGNPAAVCPLNDWIPEQMMQNIAMENNLSETAFLVKKNRDFELRWFTPEVEVDLCGHATLATAHVLFTHLDYDREIIRFETKSGLLLVRMDEELYTMDFPSGKLEKIETPDELTEALGTPPLECYRSTDHLVVLEHEEEVRNLKPDFRKLCQIDSRGFIITAPGKESDFVSRFFAPAVGIDEDPVTGSAHTMLTPYWSNRLGKDRLLARQVSRRGGELICRMKDDRVEIGGRAKTYLTGSIHIDSEG